MNILCDHHIKPEANMRYDGNSLNLLIQHSIQYRLLGTLRYCNFISPCCSIWNSTLLQPPFHNLLYKQEKSLSKLNSTLTVITMSSNAKHPIQQRKSFSSRRQIFQSTRTCNLFRQQTLLFAQYPTIMKCTQTHVSSQCNVVKLHLPTFL